MFTDDIKSLDADLVLQRFGSSANNDSSAELDFKIANFNLLDGSIFESNTNYSSNNFKLFSFAKTQADVSKSDSVFTYLYVPPYSSGKYRVNVRLNKLEIELDQAAQVLGHTSRVFDYLERSENDRPIIFSEDIDILSSGKSSLLKVDLVESLIAVTVKERLLNLLPPVNEVTDFKVNWARSNIYLHSDNSYRFNHVNKHYKNSNSYFTWGSADPTKYGSNQDPCALVYPKGLWKTPDAVEFGSITGGMINDKALLGLLQVNFPILTELLGGLGVIPTITFDELSYRIDTLQGKRFVEYATT